jgi:hypothetical protein
MGDDLSGKINKNAFTTLYHIFASDMMGFVMLIYVLFLVLHPGKSNQQRRWRPGSQQHAYPGLMAVSCELRHIRTPQTAASADTSAYIPTNSHRPRLDKYYRKIQT